MMQTGTRTCRARRIASLLLTLLLLGMGAPQDGYGLRGCAHHDAAGAPAGGGHAAHEGHGSDPAAPADPGGECTCVGVCHTSADLPRVPDSHVSVTPLVERAPVRVGWTEVERLPAPVPFSLPYPTAPPVG